MNNRKIRTKTIFLYVFCVMVPIFVTNLIIISNMLEVSRKEEREKIDNIADSIAQDITSSIESAVYVTIDLYASASIYNFLDTHYGNQIEYLQAYNRVFENYVFYASSKHIISEITLYSDNLTMYNGGRYYRIDTIRSEKWYQDFVNSGKELLIYPYYNYNAAGYDKNNSRVISVIRKLNYIELNKNEKLVKLDLNYNKINEHINSSAFDTIVYVCCSDMVIFSNDPKDRDIKKNFMASSFVPMDEVQHSKSVNSFGLDFDVYLKGYKSNYAKILKDKLWLIVILFFADAMIPAIVIALFSKSITKRVLILGKYLKKVKAEEFSVISVIEGKDEIAELLENYNLMADRMKNLIEYEFKSKLEQQELHLARQQAELLALYSQINPHFMFNVLENIRMRCVIKGEQETSLMVESLAKLMRKSAEWGSDLIPLEQEIGFMKDYLNLQKYRFGDDFNYKIKANQECYGFLVPSLLLVTFAENSCVHGFDREGHAGSIFVTVNKEDQYLHIEIEDTGVGMEEEQVFRLEKLLNEANIDDLQRTTSLGMLNASIRLKKYCGSEIIFTVESEKQVGTCIMIEIPVENMRVFK
ncbi:sensor histidine kinase [Anaerotaenia torta]|uniref:sensor histidine kinase n=1 Tax=Anaerotaenia torta TaxID=433293 RepID=UPI003D1BE041